MKRVGRYLWRKTIKLNPSVISGKTWQKFHLNLDDLISKSPQSLYRLELSINRSNSTYVCPKDDSPIKKEKPFVSADANEASKEKSGWDGIESYYYSYGDEKWVDRENPCKDALYGGY